MSGFRNEEISKIMPRKLDVLKISHNLRSKKKVTLVLHSTI